MLVLYGAEVPARRLVVAVAVVAVVVVVVIIASIASKGSTVAGIAAIANGLLIALAPPAVIADLTYLPASGARRTATSAS
jgi:hypothetical protein